MNSRFTLGLSGALLATLVVAAHAQDRLKAMPGYDNYTAMAPKYQGLIKSGAVSGVGGGGGRGGAGGGRGALPGGAGAVAPQGIVWAVDGKGVDYSWDS